MSLLTAILAFQMAYTQIPMEMSIAEVFVSHNSAPKTSQLILYAVGDGVNVWDPDGILIGKFAYVNRAANWLFRLYGYYDDSPSVQHAFAYPNYTLTCWPLLLVLQTAESTTLPSYQAVSTSSTTHFCSKSPFSKCYQKHATLGAIDRPAYV